MANGLPPLREQFSPFGSVLTPDRLQRERELKLQEQFGPGPVTGSRGAMIRGFGGIGRALSGGDKEKQRAQRNQAIVQDAQKGMQAEISKISGDTIDEDALMDAQIKAMVNTSTKLRQAGSGKDASALLQQAVAMQTQHKQKKLEREKLRAQISASEAATAESGARTAQLDADLTIQDVQNFFKIEEDGTTTFDAALSRDAAKMQRLIDGGFIALGNVGLSAVNDTLDDATSRKVIPAGTQEGFASQLNLFAGIQALKAGAANTGIIEGPLRGFFAKFGYALPGEEGTSFINMTVIRRKMRADVQSIIKGIPSNYDAGIFEATIPDPAGFASQEMYEAAVGLMDQQIRVVISSTIAFHKGTDKPFPQKLIDVANSMGIDTDSIQPMNRDLAKQAQDLFDQDLPIPMGIDPLRGGRELQAAHQKLTGTTDEDEAFLSSF